jgi:receptor protein-tyrosine kinase
VDITDYLKALASRWWVIVATLLIGLGGGYFAYTTVDPTYSATSQLFVTATGSGSVADAYQGTVLSSQRAAAYTSLVSGQQVLSRTAAQLGDESPDDLVGSVAATNTLNSPVISIAVVADNAQTAQDLANAVAANSIAYIAEVDAPEAGRPAVVKVEQTEIAALPAAPVGPDLLRFLLLGAGGGLVVGIAVAMLWTRLSNKVTEKSTASTLLDVPTLGEIPKDRALKKDSIAEFTIGHSRAAESFRKLRTSLAHVDFDNPPRAVLFTSAKAGDGKTTVVLNLAQALAEAGESVVAIEADLRRPSFAKIIDLHARAGLGDILDGSARADDAIEYPGDAGVAIISAGTLAPNPSELLGSAAMTELIDELRQRFTYVLIDSPPALPVTDASVISPLVDGVVVVAALRSSNASSLENVTKLLRTVHANVIGSVLTFVKTSSVLESTYYAVEAEPKKRGSRKPADRRAVETKAAETRAPEPEAVEHDAVTEAVARVQEPPAQPRVPVTPAAPVRPVPAPLRNGRHSVPATDDDGVDAGAGGSRRSDLFGK